jgi:glyoxylase-like metal-dependent hydrolase (beta-lactamase superfamily II)
MTLRALDLEFQGRKGVICAYLLEKGGSLALLECGPASTVAALETRLLELGIEPSAIRDVLVTHIHLDHAGAAGWLAGLGATIHCHPRAARHLVDPSRLLAGAREVYGENMESLFGRTDPVPAAQVHVLEHGERLRLGELEIEALDTPGHARHHHAYLCEGICFTGDVAGVRLSGSGYLSVASAPPQFEPEPLLKSLELLLSKAPQKLALTHFGLVDQADDHLAAYARRVREAAALAKGAVETSEIAFAEAYEQAERATALTNGVTPDLWDCYELANSTAMGAAGLLQWAKAPG